MKCEYCKDPILKFQEPRTVRGRDGKIKKYHKGCYEVLLDEFIEKIKKEEGGDNGHIRKIHKNV